MGQDAQGIGIPTPGAGCVAITAPSLADACPCSLRCEDPQGIGRMPHHGLPSPILQSRLEGKEYQIHAVGVITSDEWGAAGPVTCDEVMLVHGAGSVEPLSPRFNLQGPKSPADSLGPKIIQKR